MQKLSCSIQIIKNTVRMKTLSATKSIYNGNEMLAKSISKSYIQCVRVKTLVINQRYPVTITQKNHHTEVMSMHTLSYLTII